jgi:Sigma-70, region 4
MTQAQIGQRLCLSQMQVSRLIARALGYLRSHLLDLEVPHPSAGPVTPSLAAAADAGRPLPRDDAAAGVRAG